MVVVTDDPAKPAPPFSFAAKEVKSVGSFVQHLHVSVTEAEWTFLKTRETVDGLEPLIYIYLLEFVVWKRRLPQTF